jgi:hypothetical protein
MPEIAAYSEYIKGHHTAIVTVNALNERKNFSLWLTVRVTDY